MPAEPENRVTEHLGRLRDDVNHVDWAGAAAVRARGARRTRNHAVAGALTTLAVLGAAGFGFFGGPFRAGTDPADVAGIPVEAPAYSSSFSELSPEERAGKPSSGETEPSDTESSDTGGETTEGETGTETEPSTSPSTTPETSDDETESPTTDATTTTPSEEATSTTPSEEETTPSESPSTTTTSPPMSTSSSDQLLLAPPSMYVLADGAWSAGTTRTVESGTVSECQTSTLTDLGASDVAQRSYRHDTDPAITGGHVVGIFATEADATAAYDSLTGGVGQCTWGTPSGPNELTVDEGAAQWWSVEATSSGEYELTGFVQRGTAVAVVTMYQPRNGYSDDPAPTLQTAWELLEADS